MTKNNLADWAAISEIIGNAAVVVSLLIVAYSVTQNTNVVRAQIDNDWYQVHHANVRDHIADTSILELKIKARKNEKLSEIEEERMWYIMFKELIMWEQAFTRFNDGLVDQAQWQRTDRAFSTDLQMSFSEERWAHIKPFMRGDFANHVDSAFEKAQQ